MTRRRRATLALAGLIAVALAAAVGWYVWLKPAPADRLVLTPVAFAALDGWSTDHEIEGALTAFRRSCAVLGKPPLDRAIGSGPAQTTAGEWSAACERAAAVAAESGAARAFFEAEFAPFAARNNRRATGLFTGYYIPELRGAERPSERYRVPLYKRPDDLVTVDLGAFRDNLKGQRLAGRVVSGALRPYASRAEIEAGALKGRGLELLWVDDSIAAFFLHIQGSGRVVLENGSVQRVGFAAQNGHPYVAVGRALIERGALTRENVSLQTIRQWLRDNPGEAQALMNLNPSFVFFRTLTGEGFEGAQGVALTVERSLAVDPIHIPLGAPIWLDAQLPGAREGESGPAYRRLLIAQDTGGAIKGPVRGDVFFGPGERAETLAGRMKSEGRYFVLLPNAAAQRIKAATSR